MEDLFTNPQAFTSKRNFFHKIKSQVETMIPSICQSHGSTNQIFGGSFIRVTGLDFKLVPAGSLNENKLLLDIVWGLLGTI